MIRRIKKKIVSIVLIVLLFSGFRIMPSKLADFTDPDFYHAAAFIQKIALKHNKLFFLNLYKKEIEDCISQVTPQAQEKIDEVMLDADEYYKNFVNNPQKEYGYSKYFREMDEFEKMLDSEEFVVYSELLHITDKYLLICIGPLPMDWKETLKNVLFSYFNKFNVNYERLNEIDNYLNENKRKLDEYRTNIEKLMGKKEDNTALIMYNRATLHWIKYKNNIKTLKC